jgi:hypothetical protein
LIIVKKFTRGHLIYSSNQERYLTVDKEDQKKLIHS